MKKVAALVGSFVLGLALAAPAAGLGPPVGASPNGGNSANTPPTQEAGTHACLGPHGGLEEAHGTVVTVSQQPEDIHSFLHTVLIFEWCD